MNKFKRVDPYSLKELSLSELRAFSNEFRDSLIDHYSINGGFISSGLSVVEISLAINFLFNLDSDLLLVDDSFNTDSLNYLFDTSHSWNIKYHNPLIAAISYIKSNKYTDKNIIIVQEYESLVSPYNISLLESIRGLHSNVFVLTYNYTIESKKTGFINNLRVNDKYINIKNDLKDNLSTNRIGNSLLNSLVGVKSVIKRGVLHDNHLNEAHVDFFLINNGNSLISIINTFHASQSKSKLTVLNCFVKPSNGYNFYNDIKYLNISVEPFNIKTGKPKRAIPSDYMKADEIVIKHIISSNQNNYIISLTDKIAVSDSRKMFMFSKNNSDYIDLAISLVDNGKNVFIIMNSSQVATSYYEIMKLIYYRKNVSILINDIGLRNNLDYSNHGVYDLGVTLTLPKVSLLQGQDIYETLALIDYSLSSNGVDIIRYPSTEVKFDNKNLKNINSFNWEVYGEKNNPEYVIISYGNNLKSVVDKVIFNNLPVMIINALFIKPIDEDLLDYVSTLNKKIIVYEDSYLNSGLSSLITNYYNDKGKEINITRIGINDTYIENKSIIELKRELKIDTNYLFTLLINGREND